jgi:hypothetical protein
MRFLFLQQVFSELPGPLDILLFEVCVSESVTSHRSSLINVLLVGGGFKVGKIILLYLKIA